jgi:hypothetical protein
VRKTAVPRHKKIFEISKFIFRFGKNISETPINENNMDSKSKRFAWCQRAKNMGCCIDVRLVIVAEFLDINEAREKEMEAKKKGTKTTAHAATKAKV